MSRKRSKLTFFVKSDHFCQKRSFLTKNVKFKCFRDTVPIRCYIFSFSTLWDGRFKLSTTILPQFWNFDFIWHLQNFDGNVAIQDIDQFSRNLGKLSFSLISTTKKNFSSIRKKSRGKIHPSGWCDIYFYLYSFGAVVY